MADLTPSQEKGIGELHEVFVATEGRVVEERENGSVVYELDGKGRFEIGKRGKVQKLDDVGAGEPEDSQVPVPEDAARTEVEAVASQTSGEDGDSGNGPGLGEADASSPVEVSDEVSVSGNGSQGSYYPTDSSQNGEEPGTEQGSSPTVSGPDDPPPGEARDTTDDSTDKSVAGPDSPEPISPRSGEPVPTFDQLPQVHRQEAFEALSLADERQVTAELEGNALTSMVYGFTAGGQQVFGLSWIGAREVVRAFNARTKSEIRISDQTPPQFEDVMVMTEVGWDEEAKKPIKEERPAIRCTVYGMDAVHGSGQWGTATVPRDQVNKRKPKDENGHYQTTPDGFAANKALSKAQRNALEPMIPRQFVEELIAHYRGQDKVEYIQGSGRDVTPDLPPALTDDRAEGLKDECRELYARFKKLAGAKIKTPAWFQQQLTASQHSHGSLEDFRTALVNMVERAEAHVEGGAEWLSR